MEANFRLLQKRLGATTHVHQLDSNDYPYAKLVKLLKGIDYDGWLLLEASNKPHDLVAGLIRQRDAFVKLFGQ